MVGQCEAQGIYPAVKMPVSCWVYDNMFESTNVQVDQTIILKHISSRT